MSKLGLSSRIAHLDSTSFHVHGNYRQQAPPLAGQEIIKITQGYSRDHRPDLNQLILNLIVEHQAGIPLWMASANGNSSDKKDFRTIIRKHVKGLRNDFSLEYVIADSALYGEETLKEIASLTFFITRVPETIKGISSIFKALELEQMTPLDDNYAWTELGSIYGKVPQRWIVVHSKQAEKRALKTFQQSLKKRQEKHFRALQNLQRQAFACPVDAQKAWEQFHQQPPGLQLGQLELIPHAHYAHSGRPAVGEKPTSITYSIGGAAYSCLPTIQQEQRLKGFFILATNQLDGAKLSAADVLKEYKGQQQVERGFRFLKSPEFFTDSFCLKSPARIMA